MRTLYISLFLLISILAIAQEPRLVLPVGHLGGITNLDVSPNKSLFLTEDFNSDIIIIDCKELNELQRIILIVKKLIRVVFKMIL